MRSAMESLKNDMLLDGDSLKDMFSLQKTAGKTSQIASFSSMSLKDVDATNISSKDNTIKQTNSNIDKQQLKKKRLSGAQKRKRRKARNEISSIQQSECSSKPTEIGFLSGINKTRRSIMSTSLSERFRSSKIKNKFDNIRSIQQSKSSTSEIRTPSDDKRPRLMANSYLSAESKLNKVRNEFSNTRKMHRSEYSSRLSEVRTLSGVGSKSRFMESTFLSEGLSNVRNEFSNNSIMHPFEYNSSLTEINTVSGTSKRFIPMEKSFLSEEHISSKEPVNLSVPNAEPLPSFRMAIIKSGFPAFEIKPEEVKLIQSEILQKIDGIPMGESLPLLNNFNLLKGSLIYSCENRFTCQWLWKALDGYFFKDGTVLRVIREKDLPQLIKVIFQTNDVLTNDTNKLLLRLKSYNSEFKIENWKILEKNIDSQRQQLTMLVDIDSVKAISKANYKAYTGIDQGTFTVF